MSRKLKLTETNIRTLQLSADKNEDLLSDTEVPQLKLRLRRGADGQTRRSLSFQYSRASDQRNKSPKIKISDVGSITLTEARKIAREYNSQLARGGDPARERESSKLRQAETFGALLARYLEFERGWLRPKTYAETVRYLNVVAHSLHSLPIEKITRRDIATVKGEFTAKVANRGLKYDGKRSSNVLRNKLSGFFGWAVAEGLISENVVIGTTVEQEPKRNRVLSPAELKLVWDHAGDGDFAAIVRLLMLTAARLGEIAGLQRSEIQNDEILLPPERVKSARAFLIPLSPAARSIIDGLPHCTNLDGSLRDRVFGTGDNGFSGTHKAKLALNARIAAANGGEPIPHWTLHDLRRSFSTHLNELTIAQPHIVEACIGHVISGVHGRYNHAAYRSEKRRAFELWADKLAEWIEGRESNVAVLKRPA